MQTQKEKTIENIPNTPFRFLLHMSRPHRKWMISAMLAVVIAQVVSTSVPLIMRMVIDSAQAVSSGGADMTTVWFWALLYPVASAVLFAAWRTSGFLGMQWATRLNATSYQSLFKYLSRHSHGYFISRFAGSLSSKVSHASEGAQSLAEAFLWNYLSTIVSLMLAIVYISTTNHLAGAVFAFLIVLLVPLNVYFAKKRSPHVVAYSAQATKTRGQAVDAITNISAVRQFARRVFEQKAFNGEVDNMRYLNLRQWKMSEWSLAANNVIIVLFEAAVMIISLNAWASKVISTGELVMVVTLMLSVQGSLTFIGASMNGFIRRYGEIQEGLEDVLIPHEIVDTAEAKSLIVTEANINWKQVSFAFGGNEVFKDFSLSIPSGQRLGLVGQSGAGKTTFVSLLLRQHDVGAGSIVIDGQDIAKVTQDSLRQAIAVVPQEPALFHRSIRENILYGNLEATEEEMIEVAKKAQAHEFIMELPEGYDTLVGERGVKLSGGQKQRIAIARAMLKDAPILVLDEATSALDSESEVAIQKALETLMEGRTVIAIAHRLSTLRKMDRIIVMENGRIEEDGTHEELSNGGGVYERLWNHQAGGFLQD